MICNHLKPVLDRELSSGNRIESEETGWSTAVLVVNLEKQADVQLYSEDLKDNINLEYWENNDQHYRIQGGFFCKQCRHSLAWPK